MKLIIFGSTGTVGRQLVRQALDQGHSVTAFTRNAHKLVDISHNELWIHQGDVLDPASVNRAVRGHDAVLCALGSGRKGGVRAEGTRHIIGAMEKSGIRRFICQTTLGAGESRKNLDFFWKYIMFGWLLKEAYLDHEQQEKYIRDSPLDWTIIRPGAFTGGEATGQFRHGFPPDDRSVKLKISRADLALFMLQQLNTDEYLRKTPGVSY